MNFLSAKGVTLLSEILRSRSAIHSSFVWGLNVLLWAYSSIASAPICAASLPVPMPVEVTAFPCPSKTAVRIPTLPSIVIGLENRP